MILKFHQISCRVICGTAFKVGRLGSEKAIKKTDRLQKDSAEVSLPKTFENSNHCTMRNLVLPREKAAQVDDIKHIVTVIDKLS
jgi:hypothetical protein